MGMKDRSTAKERSEQYELTSARGWIHHPTIQRALENSAYMPYQMKDDSETYHALTDFTKQFQAYYEAHHEETASGLTLTEDNYRMNLVIYEDEPFCIDIETPYYSTRINLYPEQERYTVEVEEPLKQGFSLKRWVQKLV